ncbi:MAG: hypothetical protein HY216_13960, partial [Candidatus Rokubacteria bacterium]|nr:hypothetical protein [Candidatus Rokubacteria bacterium]
MPDDKPSPVESRQLDFLLADLAALKTEIARRAGLQRLALALYLALVAAVTGSLMADKKLAVAIAGLWMGGLLALLFWCREHLEISRLGCLISQRIAKKASAILGVPEADLVPSEVMPTVDETVDRETHRYHVAFMWLALFVTPLLLTLHALLQRLDQLAKLCACNTPIPYLALVALGGGVPSRVEIRKWRILPVGRSTTNRPSGKTA